MKVYQVTKSYFDGDHDHGKYESPLFVSRIQAEDFKRLVWDDLPDEHENKWESDCGMLEDYPPSIIELEISEQDVTEVANSEEYLHITYT